MGAWGGGLYESDHAMDLIAGQMSDDLGVNVDLIDEPEQDDSDHPPQSKSKSKSETRSYLNQGHFTRVFNQYKSIDYIDLLITGPHACVILAARAMNVGADISDEQRQYLRSIYKRCGLHKEGIEQMDKALDEYVNGTPYQLIEPDRTDHNIQMAFDNARAIAVGGFALSNYMGPSYYEEGVPTPHFSGGMVTHMRREKGEPAYFPNAPVLRQCTKCDKFQEQVEGGLKTCAGCKKIMYCDKECQKEDWPKHKMWCKTFAAMPTPPSIDSLKNAPGNQSAAGSGVTSVYTGSNATGVYTAMPKAAGGAGEGGQAQCTNQ